MTDARPAPDDSKLRMAVFARRYSIVTVLGLVGGAPGRGETLRVAVERRRFIGVVHSARAARMIVAASPK